jgi:hypothetical protein
MFERHYTVTELATAWKWSTDTVRRLFQKEPGVITITKKRRGTRIYRTLRIPESVAQRVYRRLKAGVAA